MPLTFGAIRTVSWVLAVAFVLILEACVSASVTRIANFVSSDGHFSVTVPDGSMDGSTISGAGPFAGTVVRRFIHQAPSGTVFAVFVGEAAPGYLAGITVDAALDAAEAANLQATGGYQVDERHLTVGGLPAREQRIVGPAASYVFRTVIAGNRVYSLSVKGTADEVTAADVVVYLDSFAVAP